LNSISPSASVVYLSTSCVNAASSYNVNSAPARAALSALTFSRTLSNENVATNASSVLEPFSSPGFVV